MTATPLTLYLSQTASAYITKSDQSGIAVTGGAISNKNTTIGTNTGWIELASQGSSVQSFFSGIQNPSGHGWLLDSTLLEAQSIPFGSWIPTVHLAQSTGGASISCDIHVRAFVYDSSAKTYTQIGSDIVLASQTLTSTGGIDYVFSGSAFAGAAFSTGQKLYIDVWVNVLSSTGTVANTTVIRMYAATSSAAGNASVQVVTPGYQIATAPPPAIIAASGFNDTTSPFGAFYGIFQFQGQDTNVPPYTNAYNADPANGTVTSPPTFTANSNAANPLVFGASIGYTWSQLEPSEGTYNWTLIENDMTWWAAQNKQCLLRVMTGGTKKNDSSVPHFGKTCYKATPQWVFDAGSASVTVSGTGGANDGTIYPVYWDSTYLAKYEAFITAFAARYDGDPRVHSVMIGLGCFGEGLIDESGGTLAQQLAYGWTAAGYTQAVWTTAYTTIIAAHKAAFKSTPLTVECGTTYIDWNSTYNENTIIAVALQYNIWLQDNGMVNKLSYPQSIQHHSNPAWVVTPNLEEQLKSAIQEGSVLSDDMAQNTAFGGLIAFIYTADINNIPANSATLAQYANAVTKPHGSGVH